MAYYANQDFETPDPVNTKKIAKLAFEQLGEDGIIRSAQNHYCDECTQPYKDVADTLTGQDPAGVLGIDDNRNVPSLEGSDSWKVARDAAEIKAAMEEARNQMNIDDDDDTPKAPVKMIIMDGIVMGPAHCAYDDCSESLVNYKRT